MTLIAVNLIVLQKANVFLNLFCYSIAYFVLFKFYLMRLSDEFNFVVIVLI